MSRKRGIHVGRREDVCLNPTETAMDGREGTNPAWSSRQWLSEQHGVGAVCSANTKSPGFSASQAWLSQVCLMLQGREQLRERESSQVRAELKEQPQFWKKEGEFYRNLEIGGN